MLVAADTLSAAQRAALSAIDLAAIGLPEDAAMVAGLFGCRTLLDVAELPQARIGSMGPATFSTFRSRLIQVLNGETPTSAPLAGPSPYRPAGSPVRSTVLVPVALRDRLRRIPLGAVTMPDEAFLAMREDGLTTAYDLLARDREAVAHRYRLDAGEREAMAASLRRTLHLSDIDLRFVEDSSGALTAWIGAPGRDELEPWIDLGSEQRARLRGRPVRTGEAGLAGLECERLAAAGIRTLSGLASLTRVRAGAILKVEERRLESIAARLESLARHADPFGDPAGKDVEVLRADGYGAQVCETLALAGLPTLGRFAGAALEDVPGLPGELVPGLRQAVARRLDPGLGNRGCRNGLVALSSEARQWLATQPISALEGPGIGRGIIHRLRQARLTDLAAVAEADPDWLVTLPSLSRGVTRLVAGRIATIVAETPGLGGASRVGRDAA